MKMLHQTHDHCQTNGLALPNAARTGNASPLWSAMHVSALPTVVLIQQVPELLTGVTKTNEDKSAGSSQMVWIAVALSMCAENPTVIIAANRTVELLPKSHRVGPLSCFLGRLVAQLFPCLITQRNRDHTLACFLHWQKILRNAWNTGRVSFLPVLPISFLSCVLLGTSAGYSRWECVLGPYLTLPSAVLGLYRGDTGHGGSWSKNVLSSFFIFIRYFLLGWVSGSSDLF
ncbi:hypothetical protein F5Y08DRAFT_183282 [Xylaria arbuscula]|nr:hypothetical protein F5Y08DRAFT_183282 [Xylaria arbuscula]